MDGARSRSAMGRDRSDDAGAVLWIMPASPLRDAYACLLDGMGVRHALFFDAPDEIDAIPSDQDIRLIVVDATAGTTDLGEVLRPLRAVRETLILAKLAVIVREGAPPDDGAPRALSPDAVWLAPVTARMVRDALDWSRVWA